MTMVSHRDDVAYMAEKAIRDSDLLGEEFSTPKAILSYILNNANFKSLSDVLMEAMNNAGFCDDDASIEDYIDTLQKCLLKQACDCGYEKKAVQKNINKRVRFWLTGKTDSINNRNDAIEVCFALKLDYDQTTSFLYKCGFHGFNVRDVNDAIYLYCILHHYPLSKALELIDLFHHSSECPHGCNESECIHSGNTTVMLQNQIEYSSWENDEAFLNRFLIPNKEKFFGYSTNAVKNYYFLKNNLFITVITAIAEDEYRYVQERIMYEDTIDEDAIDKHDIPISLSFRSAIRKMTDPSSMLFEYNQALLEDMSNTLEVLSGIRMLINSDERIEVQKQIAVCLSDVIKLEGLLKYVFSSLRSDNQRIKKTSASSLNKTVLKEFPNGQTGTQFETSPTIINNSQNVRKLIILMYYIAYAYELSVYNRDFRYQSPLFGEEMGFDEFIIGLNTKILKANQLQPLYYANQFDWLILRSIYEIATSDYSENGDSPVTFFDQVLAVSYGDLEEE